MSFATAPQEPSRPVPSVPLDVIRWRRDRLVHAGFAHEAARDLAADIGYDLHALLDLVDRGCPPELAVRILAPL